MSNLSVFDFEGHPVRFVGTANDPEWVAQDVCSALGIDPTQTRRLEDDQKGLRSIQTPGGMQKLTIVNESGLYELIFTSRKETAKRFKRWVFSEVLPSIRKTGGYGNVRTSPEWMARLGMYRANTQIPVGWFSIFEEMAITLMADFEEAGYILPEGCIPDISIGLCFCKHLRSLGYDTEQGSKYVRSYVHHYPDKKRKPDANIYSNELLPLYREWFALTYKPVNLPRYLKGKDPAVLPSLCKMLRLPEGSI